MMKKTLNGQVSGVPIWEDPTTVCKSYTVKMKMKSKSNILFEAL